jgi:hypothetical protein
VVDPIGVATAACYHARLAAAEEVLEEAVSRARVIAPERRVTPHLVTGSAGGALLERSLDAGLLVLGRRSGPRRHLLSPSLLSPSLDAKVVAHARCPVAVIGPFLILPAGPSAARVVVGVDRSPRSTGAIGYAYRGAARHRTDRSPCLVAASGRRLRWSDRRRRCRRGSRKAGTRPGR